METGDLPSGGRGGFTLVEMLIVAVVGAVIIIAAFGLFLTQATMVTTQREVLDVRETVRSASAILVTDVREASAAQGDLYGVYSDSIAVRSTLGGGVVCTHAWDGTERRLGMQHLGGEIGSGTSDSVLAYQPALGTWTAFDVSETWTGSPVWAIGNPNASMPVCFWGDSTTAMPRPQAAVDLAGDSTALAAVTTGSPVRSFRRTVYGLFQRDSEWWLGRREGAGTDWEVLTGPMASPTDSGFVVTYLDTLGATTTTAADVNQMRIHLRGWAAGTLSNGTRPFDSVTVFVSLRNN